MSDRHPQLPGFEASRQLVPSHPLACDCGKHFVIGCPDHGDAHLDDAIARAFEETPRFKASPAPERGKLEHRCGRCRQVLPPKRGRPRRFCDDCLTPTERAQLQQKREENERRRNREGVES
ncbi:MAG TPA: hypothetical protein VN706_05325 [Gemmatimonadaceae bacterium]|nr:hypothetical protein [Gemmatimonadaceae bacterium]